MEAQLERANKAKEKVEASQKGTKEKYNRLLKLHEAAVSQQRHTQKLLGDLLAQSFNIPSPTTPSQSEEELQALRLVVQQLRMLRDIVPSATV